MPLPALFRHHFQIAYVVRDTEQAIGVFADRMGISKWHVMDMLAVHGEQSTISKISLAYSGDVMIELIEPHGDAPSIYGGWADQAVGGIRLHHLGFLIPTPDEFAAIVGTLETAGFPTAVSGSFGDQLDFHYSDTTAELGHYYELVHLRPAGAEFFAATPQN